MKLTYELLQIPYLLLLALLVVVFSALSMLITWLIKRHAAITARRAHNEVVGYIFATVGGLYGLLLGFVVFLVWGAYNTSQSDANREGSLARGLYRDIHYFPDSARIAPLRDAYLRYVSHVVSDEYPKMQRMEPMTADDRRAFNQVFRQLEKMDSNDTRLEQMFHHLNELSTARSLRLLDGSSAIPTAIWIPLLLGALIVLLLASVLDIESRRLHILINGLLGSFVGLMFYLIIMLDHPFTGHMRVTPDEYQRILMMASEDE